MNISSVDYEISPLLSRTEILVKKLSKKNNLSIEDENELISEANLIFWEAYKNPFMFRKFFGANKDLTFFEEYIEKKLSEWISKNLSKKSGEYFVSSPSNTFNIDNIVNVFAKLTEEEKEHMLNFLYLLEKGKISMFDNDNLDLPSIKSLHTYLSSKKIRK